MTTLGELLQDPTALAQAGKNPQALMRLFLPKVARLLRPLLEGEILARIENKPAKELVGMVLNAGLGFLEEPEALFALASAKPDSKQVIKGVVGALAASLFNFIEDQNLRGTLAGALQLFVSSL